MTGGARGRSRTVLGLRFVAGPRPVLLAHTQQRPFTDTLVEKFDLPVEGWRGRREGDRPRA